MSQEEPKGVIVALSLDRDPVEVLELAEQLTPHVWGFKIHPATELAFLDQSYSIVKMLKDMGAKIFIDGKWNDIPDEVAGWTARERDRGTDIVTIHASGGPGMMDAAAKAAGDELAVLAITVLTSLNGHACEAIFGTDDIPAKVQSLAVQAHDAGCSGIVCSPKETSLLRGEHSMRPHGIIVNPGIRPKWYSQTDDQKRVATPEFARRAGASYIVVGRAIRNADDPVEAAKKTVAEFCG